MQTDNTNTPLFVDLDGTLIHTDLLIESTLQYLKQNPIGIFYIFIWLMSGKANLKSCLAERVDLNVSSLPYNHELLAYLKSEKSKGRQLFLITASHQKYADLVASFLGIFDGVIASTQQINMKGDAKLEKCRQLTPSFAYAGNDAVDFKIFKHAQQSILVNPTCSAKRLQKQDPVDQVFDNTHSKAKVILKGIRAHQWLKNLLIFVPLLVSGLYTDMAAIGHTFIAFFLFSLLASATYILNDLSDLESDRNHPRKKARPIPSGAWPLSEAILMGLGIFVFIILTAIIVTPISFQLSLLAYLILTLTYTFVLKTFVIADVIALASLFTIRIIAGAMAINVELSFWLLAFSMFTFFSLALVKRCAELKVLRKIDKSKTSGRDYRVEDYHLMQSLGVTSAFVSLLIMSFYVNTALTDDFYHTPVLLWATLPAFAYWLCRMWLKTDRGEMHDDPIVFSLKDKGSLVTIAFIIGITLVAKL
jgi:4-hydroxybenzoate polyprenyltransferase